MSAAPPRARGAGRTHRSQRARHRCPDQAQAVKRALSDVVVAHGMPVPAPAADLA